jgi:hypothetical protein
MSIWTDGVPAWWAMIVAVAALVVGVWIGWRAARRRGYDKGYDDGRADLLEAQQRQVVQLAEQAAGVAAVKRAGMLAWAQTRPAELEPLPDPRDLQDCPDDVPGCNIRHAIEEAWAVPLEYPPAEETPYAYEPWSLSAEPTLEEEVRAMIANADASPSVRWLASLETGQ